MGSWVFLEAVKIMFYGAVSWDPWLIVVQIVCLQCLYYLTLGVFMAILVGTRVSRMSLVYFFDYAAITASTVTGWCVIASFVLGSLAGSVYLLYLVERAKKCLDFSASLYIIHLFICIMYGGWPSSITWWIVNGTGIAVMALLGRSLGLDVFLSLFGLAVKRLQFSILKQQNTANTCKNNESKKRKTLTAGLALHDKFQHINWSLIPTVDSAKFQHRRLDQHCMTTHKKSPQQWCLKNLGVYYSLAAKHCNLHHYIKRSSVLQTKKHRAKFPLIFFLQHLQYFPNSSTPTPTMAGNGKQQTFTLKIEKEFDRRSERVKSVDFHPTKPWILASLHSGKVCIWNYQSQAMEKSIDVTESPVRTAKFVEREQWIVTGSDDKFIRVYDYNSAEKIKEFEAHTDYIRSVAVHPTLPYVLSASDDKLIKLWDWENDWACTRVFEGHSHYVMGVAFEPKNAVVFASASLDRSVKVWDLGSPNPSFTLEEHSKGINCVNFFTSGDKTYLITGSDDYAAKIWDYETGACVQTLEGHAHNVTAVCVHPEAPIIVTGSEDKTLRVWNATNFRLENTLNYELGRVWAIGCMKGSPQIVIGCDDGMVLAKVECSHNWDSAELQTEGEEKED
ncbi:hypothetical protein RHGRI_035270 [Rhododendron griersonianum]|uniref:Beta'-coat protein n=1 Tax=Rhododendron griersonianum TaxID=479676 RepID=A0AAV6I9V6_9ERIC|nr:hypothetical protein RHGRI_035270 [Rhododendron griersonianum]KAG5523396.1 hypothetical protein RHGRI_035270 [Rhododendron griersonianum]KAG5523398.1 hypothetical protein RHGRI_035270 [Rhododendron griersonianum]KAG5523400.1 hypothetical protein RHGRI_035270 [Rhododendron griersonianum]KAG5523401.1 hypothetical protein RHGRI_035270 [Rhododendron griersonianum]